MTDFAIKAGDLLPVLQATLSDAGGVLDLTVMTVTFRYGPISRNTGQVSRDKVCVMVDAAHGVVKVVWAGNDTWPPGKYRGEFIVTDGVTPYTYPNQTFVMLEFADRVPAPGATY